MSATFAIKTTDGKYINVAHCHNIGHDKCAVSWLNSLAPYLPADTPVHTEDSICYHVETVGDLIKLKNENNK